ncbi:MAG: energy transducer TonB [Gemmatimonadetes bacterium]|nr:energy transducer TonB [Gemmatimonadota bacterium]
MGPPRPASNDSRSSGWGSGSSTPTRCALDATTEFDLPFRLALPRSRGTLTSARRDQLGIELEPRTIRGGASLRYPPELLADSIEGRVTVGYAIDTVGRVDPRTTVVLESSHPAFTASVRTTLGALRYQPAQYSGAPQCIFSTQEFVFALQRRR